jgi:DNA-binding CsgD family transcriptional regulator
MAIIQEEMEDFVEAEKLYLLALDYAEDKLGTDEDKMMIYGNLGILKNKIEQPEKAMFYFNKVLELNNTIDSHPEMLIGVYGGMVDVYKGENKYKKATHYLELVGELEDSLSIVKDLYKVQEIENKYELKLAEEKLEKDNRLKNQLISFGAVVGVLLLVILGFIAYSYRLKASKQKILVENKSKLLETELVNLRLLTDSQKRELENKRASLTNFGLHIIWKKKLIDDLKKNLQNLKSSDNEVNQKLKKINSEIRNIQGLGSDVEDFYAQAEGLEHDFVDKYQTEDIKLTKNERKLIVLLKLGLSSKEISIINNVTEQAVKMSRHRLRSKLDVSKEITLLEFLNS